MLLQMLLDSFAVLRKPSLDSFKTHGKNELTWSVVYLAIGAVVSILVQFIRIPMQQAYLEQQQAQLRQLNANPFFTNLAEATQTPSIILLLGVYGFIYSLAVWIVVPYFIGRVLGGKGLLGQVAYNNSLVNVPLSLLDSLVVFGLTTPVSCVFLMLSLSLDVARLWLTSRGTQAAMGLAKRGDFWKILIAILLAVLLGMGLSVALTVGLVALGIGH